jgi:GNAT superfamily N-acetyltransferase
MDASAPRRAQPDDVETVTETLWLAFAEDPLWSWAFPDHAQLRPMWRLSVASALRYEWVWMIGEGAAATVWIPPGGTELTAEEEAGLPALLRELIGPRAGEVLGLYDAFDSAHPDGPPHYYLTLIGTHPEHRGQGIGMKLLAANLELIDAEGAAAYLESSNPANEPRYESVGFERTGSFTTPDRAREVATMWREPAGAG